MEGYCIQYRRGATHGPHVLENEMGISGGGFEIEELFDF
jgi:hypothetical protein